THDRWFLDRVATAVLSFEGDGKVVRYAGGYTSYREQRKAALALEAPSVAPARPAATDSKPRGEKKRGLTYGERLELESIMDRIAEAEAQVAELEARLADPALYLG